MASEAAHLAKAATNQAFLETITDGFPDWIAVVAFYKAVHLAEALFARRGTPSHSHTHRNTRLKKDHPAIWKQFRPLYNVSKLARYTDSEIPAREVRERLVARRLDSVEKLVRVELGLPEAEGIRPRSRA